MNLGDRPGYLDADEELMDRFTPPAPAGRASKKLPAWEEAHLLEGTGLVVPRTPGPVMSQSSANTPSDEFFRARES